MKKKQPALSPAEEPEEKQISPTETEPAKSADEVHTHSNYRFALKVLAVLLAIILVIVILKASGVPIAIKDWLFGFIVRIRPIASISDPTLFIL